MLQHGPVSLKVTRRIFAQLVSAVSHLHSLGIAHCDIKADNILIDQNANVSMLCALPVTAYAHNTN